MLRLKKPAAQLAASLGALLALGSVATADTVVDTLPANNQANLAADAAQTFTTGTLVDTTLTRIEIEGPQSAAGFLGPFTLEVYTDIDGDHGTWDPGALIGTSTTASLTAGGATVTAFDFPTLPVLSNNTVYGFTYTDGAGTRIGGRMGLTNASAISDGTLFSAGGTVFSDAFDTAMRILTGGPLGSVDLTIDRSTGNISLSNTTGSPIADIIGYSIFSNAGALEQAGWDQQSGSSQLVNDNDDWTVLTLPGSATDLSEAVLSTSGDGDGGDLAASSGIWNFGSVWQKSHFEDISAEILLDDGTILESGADFNIVYAGDAIDPADLNNDGAVDTLDWVAFKNAYGTDVTGMNDLEAYRNGDINLDGASDFDDFTEYRALYAAAPLAAAATNIPEPTSFMLLFAGFAAVGTHRRRTSLMLRTKTRRRELKWGAFLVAAALAVTCTSSSSVSADIVANTLPANNQANLAADAGQTFTTGSLTESGLGSIEIEASQASAGEFLGPFTLELYTDVDGDHSTWDPGSLVATSTAGTFVPGAGNITTFNFGGEMLSGNTVYGFTYTDGEGTRIGARMGLTNATAISDGTLFSGGNQVFGDAFDTAMRIITGAPVTRGINVNVDTGLVTMFGHPDPLNVTGYSITSDLGQLLPGSFNSLESQGVGDPAMTPNDGVGFEVLGVPSTTEIAEGDLTGSTVFDANTSYSLGSIFNTATAEIDRDLEIIFSTTGSDFVGTVNYVTGGLDGDFDGDNDVDGADFLRWQRGEAPGGATAANLALWESNFGAPSAAVSAAAVPEPGAAALALIGGALAAACGRRRRRAAATSAGRCNRLRPVSFSLAQLAAAMLIASTSFAYQNDRDYTLGDDGDENASAGNNLTGTTFDSAGTLGAGDLQDLTVTGTPTYVNVNTRPGAGGGDLGAEFDGSNDYLSTIISMNAPTQMYNNTTYFPGPPPAVFPHNYAGIFSHGMQLWAQPDAPTGNGSIQTLIEDSNQHGFHITSDGNWGYRFRASRFDSGIPVSSTLDSNGWAHVFEMSGANVAGAGNAIEGNSAFGGAVLVNGVAVIARGTFYDPSTTSLSIGAGCIGGDCANGAENHYDGVLDDVRIFFWGDNSDDLGDDDAVGGANTATNMLNADGQNWGPLDLNVDNDWIALELDRLATLAGVGSIPETDLNFDGATDLADETIFRANWLDSNTVADGAGNQVRVGDWNSRQKGDFNYDGLVDLSDAFVLHEALAPLGGLNFAALGVPEPSTCVILLTGLAAAFCRRL